MRILSVLSKIKNPQRIRVYMLLFSVGFIFSLLFFYAFRASFASEVEAYKESVFLLPSGSDVVSSELFFLSSIKQLRNYIILWLFAITSLGIPYMSFLSLYKGFTLGFLFSVLFAAYRFKSIYLFGGMLFPHAMVYVLIYLASFVLIAKRSKGYHVKGWVYVLLVLGIVLGCFLESYVNYPILQQIF